MSGSTKLMTAGGGGVVITPASSIASDVTVSVPSVNCTLNPLISGTEVASTSGTSIDFTGIPSWVKRITVMFNGISTNGSTAAFIIQLGSGSIVSSGYASQVWAASSSSTVITTGFITNSSIGSASYALSGTVVLTLIGSNTWISNGSLNYTNVTSVGYSSSGNSPALSGALDRVRITTFGGTETFDTGSINILYE